MRDLLKALVELFRPRWRHPDAEVRAEARRLDDTLVLERIRDADSEPQVREAAGRRLDELAEGDVG